MDPFGVDFVVCALGTPNRANAAADARQIARDVARSTASFALSKRSTRARRPPPRGAVGMTCEYRSVVIAIWE